MRERYAQEDRMDVKVRKIDSVAILDLDGRLTLAENTL
jgi:hypothetical protein